MYGFEGFVYTLDSCPSKTQLASDFQTMKSVGARMVITFSVCNSGTDSSYHGDVISAASAAEIYIIPLVWTLLDNSGQTFSKDVVPIMKAVTEAVIKNPSPVIAVALGDEPLYDNDAGSPANLAKYILQMKSDFAAVGLSDMPISISDMAYG
ncbi:hypothetical protein M0805_003729 [Coniferiporia weirii]|nr:hypothetical protein M0805_003729 [Coniferiporia weirii]